MSEVEREVHRREDAAIDHLCAVLSELDRRPVTIVNHLDRLRITTLFWYFRRTLLESS